MVRSAKQQSLTSFFGTKRSSSDSLAVAKRPRRLNGSAFGHCPLCQRRIALHQLERHAADCEGPVEETKATDRRLLHTAEPIPGLYLFEDFITEQEEAEILAALDGSTDPEDFLPWKFAGFNGDHFGKRWGVHCNLRDKRVSEAEHPLPRFVESLLKPKLRVIQHVADFVPNEANAIDYRRDSGHYLASHVDDRQLSREPIANLSLAGDCYMTFENVAPQRNTAVRTKRVLLKRRCLQVLTGKARYDFSHGITNSDLLSPRRVSLTMRESPLTTNATTAVVPGTSWWKTPSPCTKSWLQSSEEPVPGLFLFTDFINEAEEAAILTELDDSGSPQQWKVEQHSGTHREKRFGVDHDLWTRQVRPPKHDMPSFVGNLLLPRLERIRAMNGCVPNECNAIEYRRQLGHSLKAHVDDRAKHKEPIANLSLAGDCYMTFASTRDAAVAKKVLLRRRCLVVMTGKARYDYTHGISNEDLLADRRVSLTLRETPGV